MSRRNASATVGAGNDDRVWTFPDELVDYQFRAMARRARWVTELMVISVGVLRPPEEKPRPGALFDPLEWFADAAPVDTS